MHKKLGVLPKTTKCMSTITSNVIFSESTKQRYSVAVCVGGGGGEGSRRIFVCIGVCRTLNYYPIIQLFQPGCPGKMPLKHAIAACSFIYVVPSHKPITTIRLLRHGQLIHQSRGGILSDIELSLS